MARHGDPIGAAPMSAEAIEPPMQATAGRRPRRVGERRSSTRASVTKRFGGLVAVRDVDFAIPERAIVSLIGPNGAGKTTFFNIVAGIFDPTAGEIVFHGRK